MNTSLLLAATHPTHAALKGLVSGDSVRLDPSGEHIRIIDVSGVSVGRLSAQGASQWSDRLDQIEAIKVIGVYTRRREDITDKGFLNKIRCDTWEIPICEIAYRPASVTSTCATSSSPS